MVKLLPKNPRIRFVSPYDPNKVVEFKIDNHGKIINNDFQQSKNKGNLNMTKIEIPKITHKPQYNFTNRFFSCPAGHITPPYLKPKYQINRPISPCDNNPPDYSEFAHFMFSTETPNMYEYNTY